MCKPSHAPAAAFLLLLLPTAASWAAQNDWAEGTPGQPNGASRDYYNRAGLLRWEHPMGDWLDAKDVPQGNIPFATAIVRDSEKWVEWDLTDLVRRWMEDTVQNQGIFLQCLEEGGTCKFHSRECPDVGKRPQLVLSGAGNSLSLAPNADTFLDRSTYRSQGDSETLVLAAESCHALLRFGLGGVDKRTRVDEATLRMYCSARDGNQPAATGVFRCCQGESKPPSEPIKGLAWNYIGDRGIEKDPDVVFFTGFESERWPDEWTYAADRKVLATTDSDLPCKLDPLQGKALRVRIAQGATGALNTIYKFQQKIGREPEQVYFRYYLRLADDWNQTVQGGKLPGISGTYGVAGWGGRKADGTEGWSARGAFHLTIPADNPLARTTPIGTYCYHADMHDNYGDIWIWQRDYRGYLKNNRWYCLEQYLKLNAPDKKDGVMRAWVDGHLAFEKLDIRFRRTDRLKIEQVWMNVYHGGTTPSPYDQHLYIDNVVIANQYVGPLHAGPSGQSDQSR